MEQKIITESQLNDVAAVILGQQGIINLEEDDVRYVLAGKRGVWYSAQQGEMDYQQFMKHTFQELSNKPQVKECQYMLMNIGMSAEDPMTMEDMGIINEFIGSLMNDALETKWSLKMNADGERMSIHILCTNDIH